MMINIEVDKRVALTILSKSLIIKDRPATILQLDSTPGERNLTLSQLTKGAAPGIGSETFAWRNPGSEVGKQSPATFQREIPLVEENPSGMRECQLIATNNNPFVKVTPLVVVKCINKI